MKRLRNILTFVSLLPLALLLIQGCNENGMKGVTGDLNNVQSKASSTNLSDTYLSDYSVINKSDIPELCEVDTLCLIAGQHNDVGYVIVGNDVDGNLYVTYHTNGDYTLAEVHLAVAASKEDFPQTGSGNPKIGNFPYGIEFTEDYPSTYSIKVTDPPLDENKCTFIAAHAVVQGGSESQTAWAGPCEDGQFTSNALEFTPGVQGSWARYFQYCEGTGCKKIDYTYAWEDLKEGNDADYNDVVIKSHHQIWTANDTTYLKLTYYLTARGAAYDHIFSINLPITGNYRFNNGTTMSSSGETAVEIFPSTKTALPKNNVGYDFGANTSAQNTCLGAPADTTILVKIFDGGTLGGSAPFDPFITVFPSGTVGTGASYDLHIYALTNDVSDLYTFDDPGNKYPGKVGLEFPNGIFIPSDWKWPLEKTAIWVPYPDFNSSNWADNLADGSKVFDKSACPAN